jgi:phosphoribosylformylglycinamidine (FGAM) synthase-like amidotransferase family enzyme
MLTLTGQTKLVVPGGFDLGDKITEQNFHDWYNKEVSAEKFS